MMQENRKKTQQEKEEMKIDNKIIYRKELKEGSIEEQEDYRHKILVVMRGQLRKDYANDW